MPTISLSHKLLQEIQYMHGSSYSSDDWLEKLSQIGCVVEDSNEEHIEIEVFPDRPDLLSHETMARAARSFLYEKSQDPAIQVSDSGISIDVNPSLKDIRPVIFGAVVKGVNTGRNEQQKDAFIQSLMDHQEKLHLSIGRRRKFASIGVHDLSKIQPPFRYETVGSDFTFIPLASKEKMSVSEILSKHPKGIEYAHLMEDFDRYPIILDSNNDLISFPPIINGDHTTVKETTTDFFIDVTGTDERACEACLLLVCLSLLERGGRVESVEINGWDNKISLYPIGDAKRHRVPDSLIKKILGLDLEIEEISRSISRMGGELISSRVVTEGVNKSERWSDLVVGEREHVIAMPRWRSDIMHPIDLVEDIAIGYGYENMPEIYSSVHLDAVPLNSSNINRRVRESLRALGIQETQSLTLSCDKDQFEKMRWDERSNVTRLANPITIEHTILRQRILPSLMNLLSANRHHELPQKVYELGTVVLDSKNCNSVSWACAEVTGGFTAAKGYAQALLRDLGAISEDIDWIPTNPNSGPWITGRGARVIVSGEEVGQIGEIDPSVSSEFGLRVPIHAGEFDIDALRKLIQDPVL